MILDELLNESDNTVCMNYEELFIFYWGGGLVCHIWGQFFF